MRKQKFKTRHVYDSWPPPPKKRVISPKSKLPLNVGYRETFDQDEELSGPIYDTKTETEITEQAEEREEEQEEQEKKQ